MEKTIKKRKLSRSVSTDESVFPNVCDETTNEAGDDNRSVEDQVFSIDLVLTMILRNMSSSDLLRNIRLVNPRWHFASTKILEERRDISIMFDYSTKCQCYLQQRLFGGMKGATDNALGSLTQLLNDSFSDQFPCSDFTFDGGELNEVQLQQFLDCHGSLITNLTLKLNNDNEYDAKCHDLSTLASFRKLLTEQAPNIEYLSMEYFPPRWGESPFGSILQLNKKAPQLFPDNSGPGQQQTLLPNLKIIDFEEIMPRTEILLELVDAAPNLEKLYVLQLNETLVDYLIEKDRLSLLSVCTRFVFTSANMRAYEKFADAQVKLSKLELDLSQIEPNVEDSIKARVAQCLCKVFDASSESLKAVAWGPVGHVSGIYIPELTSVKNITIRDFVDEDALEDLGWAWQVLARQPTTLFPIGRSMKSIFPNLVSVEFNNDYNFKASFIDNFEPLLTVEKLSFLEISCFTPEILGKLCGMFPNVVQGVFSGIHDFRKVSNVIWKFSKLEKLLVEIYACAKANTYPAVDMGFTGLDLDTVQVLRVMTEKEVEEELDLNLLRNNNPSILDLKNLKLLTIDICDTANEKLKDYCNPLITDLTGRFALDLLPPHVQIHMKILSSEPANLNELKKCVEQMNHYTNSVTIQHA